MKQIDSQLSSIQNKLDATAKSLGYAKSEQREKKPETIKVTNGKETLLIPISDLADAEKDGYKKVQNMAGGQ